MFDRYDEFVNSHPDSSIYHTREWMNFITHNFATESLTLVAVDNNSIHGVLALAIQKRLFNRWEITSLPFSHRVPVLAAPGIAELLWNEALRHGQRYNCPVEIRSPVSTVINARNSLYVNTVVDLPATLDDLSRQVRVNTMQQLKQALANPSLTSRQAESDADFIAMDEIMAINRRYLHSATYPAGFFKRFKSHIGDNAFLEIAFDKDTPVAMFVASILGENAIYHYGASLVTSPVRKLRPNNLLYWRALEHAIKNNVSSFDFGTSLLSQHGLIRFKESWGGKTFALKYTSSAEVNDNAKSRITQNSQLARLAGYIFSKMPLPLFKIITPLVLKEFG